MLSLYDNNIFLITLRVSEILRFVIQGLMLHVQFTKLFASYFAPDCSLVKEPKAIRVPFGEYIDQCIWNCVFQSRELVWGAQNNSQDLYLEEHGRCIRLVACEPLLSTFENHQFAVFQRTIYHCL